MNPSELYVPHTGWLIHEPGDEVARFLAEGWFEYKEQAFLWLYLRSGDFILDGGAQIGLFSIIAGRAIGNRGHILALEPHPGSAAILERNLRQNGISAAQVRQSALSSFSGSATFEAGNPGKSAYSRLSSGGGTTVETVTLDDLLISADRPVAFAKIDVEGAELQVIEGATEVIRRGVLPLLMIECTEANLQNFGGDTKALFEKLSAAGYVICRFDAVLRQLVPRAYEGAIGYDNLFAARDIASVNRRLAEAPDAIQRIASDILTRGAASEKLYHLSSESANARLSAADAFRAGGEANWRAEQAERRAEAAEKRAEEARKQVQASEARAEQARKRAEEAAQATEEAFRAGGEANWRAEQAELRAEAAEKRAEEARKGVHAAEARAEQARKNAEAAAQAMEEAFRAGGEANWRADEARRQADELLRSAETALQRLGRADSRIAEADGRVLTAREALLSSEARAAELRLRLQELLASRYVRAGWKLGLFRKPEWIDKTLP
jgi:FkbM family methyltransferase